MKFTFGDRSLSLRGPNLGALTSVFTGGQMKGIDPNSRLWPTFMSLLSSMTGQSQTQLMKSYNEVGWVYAAVSRLSSAVAEAEWRAYDKRDPRERQEIDSSPTLAILHEPNPFMSGMDLFEISQLYMDLVGEWWWLIVPNNRGDLPAEIWPLNPAKMTVIPHPTEFIAGYVYTVGQEQIPLDREDIIYHHLPNPADPYRGVGPVQSIFLDIQGERFSAQWNRNFFLNSANPGGIITVEKTLPDKQYNRLLEQWNDQHQGVDRAHKVAVLEAGAKFNQNKMSQKDMDFSNTRSHNRDIILGAFGIPLHILGISESVNRANAEAAEFTFSRWSVRPRLKRFRNKLNMELVPRFGNGEYLDFDDPVPENEEFTLKKAMGAFAAGLAKRNEGRALLGFDPVDDDEGGDDFKVPAPPPGSTPPPPEETPPEPPEDELEEEEEGLTMPAAIGKIDWNGVEDVIGCYVDRQASMKLGEIVYVKIPDGELEKSIIELAAEVKELTLEIYKAPKEVLIRTPSWDDLAPEVRKPQNMLSRTPSEIAISKAFEDTLNPQEDEFSKAIRDLWERQFDAVVDALVEDEDGVVILGYEFHDVDWAFKQAHTEPTGERYTSLSKDPVAGTPGPFDDAFWETQTGKEMRPLVEKALMGAGRKFAIQYGFEWDPESEEVQRWLGSRMQQFSKNVTATTQGQVDAALAAGQAAGEGIPEITKRLRQVFFETGDELRATLTRSRQIARTEMVAANNQGKFEGAVQSGVVLSKSWLTAIDGRQRDTHEDAHRQEVGLHDLFQVGSDSMMVPGQGALASENINCVLPGNPVEASGILSASRAYYDGPALELRTKRGHKLTVTPNHPILTPRGFVAAQRLAPGDNVLSGLRSEWMHPVHQDITNVPPSIEEVFSALSVVPRSAAGRKTAAVSDFHGDGRMMNGDIDIVGTDGFLVCTCDAVFTHQRQEIELQRGSLCQCAFFGLGLKATQFEFPFGTNLPSTRIGRTRESFSLVGRDSRHAGEHALATISRGDTGHKQPTPEHITVDSQLGGESFFRLPSFISADEISEIRYFDFAGHVYDLQTLDGLYIGGGIVAHNCRCTFREQVLPPDQRAVEPVELRCKSCNRLHARDGEIKCKCGDMVPLQ